MRSSNRRLSFLLLALLASGAALDGQDIPLGVEAVRLMERANAVSRPAVLGSFAAEKFGLDRLRSLKRNEIHARARHFAKLTQFKL